MPGKRLRNPPTRKRLPAMMTAAQVAELRLSGESPWAYARRLGLPPSVAYNAAYGLTWKGHVVPPRERKGQQARRDVKPVIVHEIGPSGELRAAPWSALVTESAS